MTGEEEAVLTQYLLHYWEIENDQNFDSWYIDEMAGGAHVNACRVQVQLGQSRRFCPALACAHHSLHDYRVGVSPEGVADNVQSPERDRLWWGVTNDAVVRLPDHAMDRAIRTSVCSVFVRTTRLAMSIHPGADSPVSRLCTGRARA